MATTSKYALTKPDAGATDWHTAMNANMDTLDAKLGAAHEADGSHSTGSITTDDIANSAVTTNKILDGCITNPKLAASVITADKIADDAVTAAKVGSMVPALLGRQGGNATDWSSNGNTNYTSGQNVRIQCGVSATDAYGQREITFPVAFSAVPLVIASPFELETDTGMATVVIRGVSTTGIFFATWYHRSAATPDTTAMFAPGLKFSWLAIGPE